MRFDDLVRSERYFTATLLPLLLFHNAMEGVQGFIDLIEANAKTEHNKIGQQNKKDVLDCHYQDVEVITEFHIARDLRFAGLHMCSSASPPDGAGSAEPPSVVADEVEDDLLDRPPAEAAIHLHSADVARQRRDAPDLVIVAGQEMWVCEGKFFGQTPYNLNDLNHQLCSQRVQICHLFCNRSLRAYRHVAILPELHYPRESIDADAVITWDDIRQIAEDLMGPHHYVTVRLRKAVERYRKLQGCPGICSWDGRESFAEMLNKSRASPKPLQVGCAGGENALRRMSLPKLEERIWRWRDPETNKGNIIRKNWLSAKCWLRILT